MKLKLNGKNQAVYDLQQRPVTVGRAAGNDIIINHPDISRHHARFFRKNGRLFIEDLGSTNGTWINDRRVKGSGCELKKGMQIRFAGVGGKIEGGGSDFGGRETLFSGFSHSSSMAWGLGGAIAALCLVAALYFISQPASPRFAGGGGGRSVIVSSKRNEPAKSNSHISEILTGGPVKTNPSASAGSGSREMSGLQGPFSSGVSVRATAPIVVRVPGSVQARCSANSQPWKAISLPADPLPVQPAGQLPRWLGNLGLKPELFDGFDMSLTQGTFRAAISNKALEKLLTNAGRYQPTGSRADSTTQIFQAAVYHPDTDGTPFFLVSSHDVNNGRTKPYLEINGKFEPGSPLRIFGTLSLRPPDQSVGQRRFEWVKQCKPVGFDLFLGEEELVYGKVQAPEIKMGADNGKDQYRFSEFDLEVSELPLAYPFKGASGRARLGSAYCRDGPDEIRIGPTDLALKTAKDDPFSGWAVDAQVGAITLKKNGTHLMRFEGGNLSGRPGTAAAGQVAIETAVELGAVVAAPSAGVPQLWSALDINLGMTGPRQQLQDIYTLASRAGTVFSQNRGQQVLNSDGERLFSRFLTLFSQDLRFDYQVNITRKAGQSKVKATVTWPDNLNMNGMDIQKGVEFLKQMAVVKVYAEAPETSLQRVMDRTGFKKAFSRAVASGKVTCQSNDLMRMGIIRDHSGIRIVSPDTLFGEKNNALESETSQDKTDNIPDNLFPVYGPDSRIYYASVHSDKDNELCGGSSPFLNIIEDANTKSAAGEIKPQIWIDGLTLYESDQKTALTWDKARPIIIKSLCLMPGLMETFPASDFEVHDLDSGGRFYLPATFQSFVTDDWVADDDKRQAMYSKVFLDLFIAEEFYSQALEKGTDLSSAWAGDFIQTMTSCGNALEKMEDIAQSAELTAWMTLMRQASSSVNAAASHGQTVDTAAVKKIVGKVESRNSKVFDSLGWIVLGIEACNEFTDTQARTAVMIKSAQLAGQQARAQAVVDLLKETCGIDSSIPRGAEDALKLMKALEEERFSAFTQGLLAAGTLVSKELMKKGVEYAVKKVPFLNSANLPVGFAGGVVSGLITVGYETWETGKTASYLGCLATSGKVLSEAAKELIEGRKVGTINPVDADLNSLIRFNHQHAFLSYYTLNQELFRDVPLAKAPVYWLKGNFNDEGLKFWNWGKNCDTEESLLHSEERILNILLMETGTDASFWDLILEIKSKYTPAAAGE